MIGAGALRERFSFEKRSAIDDGMGNPEAGHFTTQFTVWAAEIQPRFGSEQVMAARLEGRQPITIRIRQSSETRQITTDWRAARNGVVYNIRSILDPFASSSQRGAWFDLLMEGGVAT